MAVKFARWGDGTLKIGPTPTQLDISAQVVGCWFRSSVDTGDSLKMLSGDTLSSGLTTSGTLEGSLVLDPETGGIGEFSWLQHGTLQAFEFVPSTVAGIVIPGEVTILRLDIGADAHGNLLQPSFSWAATVANDALTWGVAAP